MDNKFEQRENELENEDIFGTDPNSPIDPIRNYNPLSESVNEKDYGKPPIAEGVINDLEEPTFHQQTFDEIRTGNQANDPFIQQQQQQQQAPNPSFNDLDTREKRLSSEAAVDTILDLYGAAHEIGQKFVTIDEQKLRNAINAGKYDGEKRITIDENGTTVNILEFVNQYNQSVSETIKLEKTFVKKVREPMIRIFQKKGWGLTDEQTVMLAFGTDIAGKVMMGYNMQKSCKSVIALTALSDAEQSSRPFNPPTPSTPPPTPEPENPNIIRTDASKRYEVIDIEDTDEVGSIMDEMVENNEAQKRGRGRKKKEGTEKFKITFEDNPLRQKPKKRDLSKNVKVKETFTQSK
jgi:hypothetical protein